jgi:hypothetical protein
VRKPKKACAVGSSDLPVSKCLSPPPPSIPVCLLLPILFPNGHKEGLAGKSQWIKIHFMSLHVTPPDLRGAKSLTANFASTSLRELPFSCCSGQRLKDILQQSSYLLPISDPQGMQKRAVLINSSVSHATPQSAYQQNVIPLHTGATNVRDYITATPNIYFLLLLFSFSFFHLLLFIFCLHFIPSFTSSSSSSSSSCSSSSSSYYYYYYYF